MDARVPVASLSTHLERGATLTTPSPEMVPGITEGHRRGGMLDTPRPASAGDVEDGTCAICLDVIPEADVAMVATCLHAFCAPCIVRWTNFQLETAARRLNSAVATSDPTCPCCKAPFSSLLVYRTLDGDLRGDLTEESVCLLRRARWLPETAKSAEWEDDHAVAVAAQAALNAEGGFFEEDFDVYDEDYLDDEEEYMEGLYRRGSRGGGGRPAIVIGNRRFGANGHISQGQRIYARPVPQEQPAMGKGGRRKGGKGKSPIPKGRATPEGKGKAPASSSAPGGSSSAAIDVPVASAPAASPTASPAVSPSPSGSTHTPSGAARGKKAQKRAEAKAKKEEKEALRRLRRAENMITVARAKATKATAVGSLESQLPNLSDIGDSDDDETVESAAGRTFENSGGSSSSAVFASASASTSTTERGEEEVFALD